MEERIPIDKIQLGNRSRKQFGDLKGLAHSIKTMGLLQAIGVTKKDNRLLFGERRLRAVQLNGDKEIDCRVLDIDDILAAEDAENRFRLELTLSEKAALAEEMERRAREMRGGKSAKGHQNQYTKKKLLKGQVVPSANPPVETKARIATKAGFRSLLRYRTNRRRSRGKSSVLEKMGRYGPPPDEVCCIGTL